MRDIRVAPSILAANFGRLAEDVAAVAQAGADWIHIDVMDGHFVPNISFGPAVMQAVRGVTDIPFDVHLMISEPDKYIDAFVRAGADRITVHAEACTHLHRVIDQVKAAGVPVGVALNPATPLSAIEEVLADVDLVLVMTVNPGFGGQTFIPASINKLERLTTMLRVRQLHNKVDVQVDGGITADTAQLVRRAGANVLVAGSSIFGAADLQGAVKLIRGT